MAKSTEQQPAEPDYAAVAQAVLKIGQAATAMSRAGLTQRAVCLLIRDMTHVGMEDIERVLWAAKNLPGKFLTPEFLKQHGVMTKA